MQPCHVLPLLALVVFAPACKQDARLPLDLVLVPDKQDCGDPAVNPQALPQGLFSIRLTFMRRREAEPVREASLRSYDLICDRIFDPSLPGQEKQAVDVIVPGISSRYALRVEAFNPSSRALEYAGQVEDLDFNQPTARIFLRPAASSQRQASDPPRGQSCVPQARRYRAFHSSTLLPNGQVLLIGGLSAEPGDANSPTLHIEDTEVAYSTDSLEVYDPSAMSFQLVPLSQAMPPRAFHQAHLLPSPAGGPYQVLLLGGVTAGSEPAFFFRKSRQGLPFLLSPHDRAAPAEAGILTYTPPSATDRNGGAGYTPLPDLPRALFPASVLDPGRNALITVGGGASHVPVYKDPDPKGSSNYQKNDDRGFKSDPPWLFLDAQVSPPRPSPVPARGETRAGQVIAQLGTNGYLVVGGTMTGPLSAPGDVASLLTLGPGNPPAMDLVPLSLPATFQASAFHGLTPQISDIDLLRKSPATLLWSGGLRLENDNASFMRFAGDPLPREPKSPADPRTEELYLARISEGTPPTLGLITAPGKKLLPAGYLDATRLWDGSVLISGGNANKLISPRAAADYSDPVECKDNAFCPLAQVAIVPATDRTPESTPRLATRRFGHRGTRLLDNTVLITGGITMLDQIVQLTHNAEIYSPRTGVADEDFPFRRDPNVDCDGSAACRESIGPPPEGRWRCWLVQE